MGWDVYGWDGMYQDRIQATWDVGLEYRLCMCVYVFALDLVKVVCWMLDAGCWMLDAAGYLLAGRMENDASCGL